MNDWSSQGPEAFLDRLERAATRQETPCGDGRIKSGHDDVKTGLTPGSIRDDRIKSGHDDVKTGLTPGSIRDGRMVWHLWGDAKAPVLVLFHGGAGSWRHWAHNIDVLSQRYRLLVPDLPGLGESAFPPDGDDAMAVAGIVARGIGIVLGDGVRYDVAGFSFGGTMATCVGALHGERVRSVTIIGSSGVGPAGSAVELMKVRHLTGEERVAAHRINLGRLMIADPAKIDALALAIQEWNTRHSRLKTPTLSRSGALPRALAAVTGRVNGIWGELDAPANPRAKLRVAALRELRPDADIRMIEGAGHWVAYEAPDQFHAMLLEMLEQRQ